MNEPRFAGTIGRSVEQLTRRWAPQPRPVAGCLMQALQ